MEDSAEIIGKNLVISSNTIKNDDFGAFSVSGTSAMMQSKEQNFISFVGTSTAEAHMFAQYDLNSSLFFCRG